MPAKTQGATGRLDPVVASRDGGRIEITISVTVKVNTTAGATALPGSAGVNAGAGQPSVANAEFYADNHPNLPVVRGGSNWEEKWTTQPFLAPLTCATMCIHQGLGMSVPGTRANTKSILDAWRALNPKGILAWHWNYRTFPANDLNSGNNGYYRLFNYIIEGQRWQHLFHRASNYDIQAGYSITTSAFGGEGEWNTAYQNADLQNWVKEDLWNMMSDDDSGTGTPGSNSIVHLRPVFMQDNWGEYNEGKFRAANPFFNGTKTINSVVSQTVLRIAAISLDLTGEPADGNGYFPVEEDNVFFGWPSAQNQSCGIIILGHKTVGSESEIKLASGPTNWSFSSGQEYFIANTKSAGFNTEWDDPPGGVDLGDDPDERRVAMFNLMNGINREAESRYDYWLPIVSNGLGEDAFWWGGAQPAKRTRIDHPTANGDSHFARQTELGNFIDKSLKTSDDVIYHAKNYTSDLREWIVREILWGRELIDEDNASVPADLAPPAGRGCFFEIDPRRVSGNRALNPALMTELDACKLNWCWFWSMAHTACLMQTKSGIMTEFQLLYPGDPKDPAFPHERNVGTIAAWDPVYTGTPETVIWRSADFGPWGYVVEFPSLLVGGNLRVPSQKEPWIASHLPGGQSLDPAKDVYTLPSAGAGMSWYRPSATTVNPVTGFGPSSFPFTEPGAVLIQDRILNDGSKVTGTVNCGPMEVFALIKAAE